MKSKDLAEFYNVHERTARKWSQEQRHRKTIQAEADVTPLEWQLVGEISQLCYLYNAQNWHCESPMTWAFLAMNSFELAVDVYDSWKSTTPVCSMKAKTSNTAEMQLIKMQLEKLVYGEEK